MRAPISALAISMGRHDVTQLDQDLLTDLATYRPGKDVQADLESPQVRASARPFEEVFAPVRDHVAPRLQSLSRLISSAAAKDLEDEVIAELSDHFSQLLLAEFSAERPAGFVVIARLCKPADNVDRTLYREFVWSMWGGRLLAILEEYPVFKRLLSLIVQTKLDEATEFAHRVEA